MTKLNYNEYLASQEWKSIRAAHLLQYPKCERCGSENNLQVHHLYYEDDLGSVLGRETSGCLATLCSNCHLELHEELAAAKLQIDAVMRQQQPKVDAVIAETEDKVSDVTSSCIAKFFGKHKVKRFPYLAAVINAELTPKVQFSLNTSAYIKKAAILRKQSK